MSSALFIDPSAARTDPDQAIDFLAHHLRDGSLALALGAGVSRHLSLPRWFELVNGCSKEASLPATFGKSTPADALCERMEAIEKKTSPDGKAGKGQFPAYRNLVKRALYKGINFDNILNGELLMAIGALLMGSKRGSITEIITFNFDDVLEWYLRLHGYTVNVISGLPALRTNADVTIYHPHGFLPFHPDFRDSDFLLFSKRSYDKKLGDSVEPWTEITKALLKSKVTLFVGLSGDDQTFGPIFDNVHTSLGTSRPTGVWMFTKKDKTERLDQIEDRNFIVLEFDKHEDWPAFLLKICQRAAALP